MGGIDHTLKLLDLDEGRLDPDRAEALGRALVKGAALGRILGIPSTSS